MRPTRSTDLEVVEQGGGGQLVVFVHGVFDRGGAFDPVVRLLSAECRMLAYDRRGYGRSVNAHGVPADIHRHVADLLTILDGRSAVLVGHSFGGYVALGAALEAPELTQALVMYESALAWTPGWDDRVLAPLLQAEGAEEAAVRLMFSRQIEVMTEEQRAFRLREAKTFVVEERSVRTNGPPFDLSSLEVPLVYGYSATEPFARVAEYLRRTLPAVETVVLPGAGHNAHRSAPERFADLVRRGIALGAGRRPAPRGQEA